MIEAPRVPSPLADAVKHADYLELLALVEKDRSASIHDLGRVLAQPGGLGELPPDEDDEDPEDYPSDQGGERVQELTRIAATEVERRIGVCGPRYPFDLDERGVLAAKEDADLSVYVFLLLLTPPTAQTMGCRERKLFERVSTEIAAAYLGGEEYVVRECFGFPRDDSSGFEKALKGLCEKIGEGVVQSGIQSLGDQKDGGVDLVAVKRFPDSRVGQLAIFGQCATGQDWRDKLPDLQPKDFMKLWMSDQLAVDPIKAFFVPVAIEEGSWRKVAMKGGVPFDRIRIVHHAATLPADLLQELREYNVQSLTALRYD